MATTIPARNTMGDAMSQGREGYVPGGYKLVEALWYSPHIILVYRNANATEFVRIVDSSQKGYRHAVKLLRKFNEE